jgi:nitrite reductase (NADH) small subunit
MTKHYRLGPMSQIPPGEGRNFEIDGQRVAVFRTRSDALYATQASCPHRQGPLADGLVGDSVLICPLHEWSFDLATGQPRNGTCNIAVYPISRSEDGQLELELPARTSSTSVRAAAELGADAED